MVQSWWILLLAGRPDVRCSKIITPTVNIIVYDSIFQRCDRHRQLPGYLSFNSLTLEPSCRHWFSTQLTQQAWLVCKWERNKASLNPVIYLRCFTSNGVSIIGAFIENPCLNYRVSLPPFWNFECGSRELLYSNKFHKYSLFCKLPIVY